MLFLFFIPQNNKLYHAIPNLCSGAEHQNLYCVLIPRLTERKSNYNVVVSLFNFNAKINNRSRYDKNVIITCHSKVMLRSRTSELVLFVVCNSNQGVNKENSIEIVCIYIRHFHQNSRNEICMSKS